MKARRELGLATDEIFRQQLQKFPRFEAMLSEGPLGEINVTSFRCRAHVRCAGANWLMAGECRIDGRPHHCQWSHRGSCVTPPRRLR